MLTQRFSAGPLLSDAAAVKPWYCTTEHLWSVSITLLQCAMQLVVNLCDVPLELGLPYPSDTCAELQHVCCSATSGAAVNHGVLLPQRRYVSVTNPLRIINHHAHGAI